MFPDREVVSTRNVKFSRARVWNAWTDPAQLARWWGPNGFTNTFHLHELRPGGPWKFTMHGPDGNNYENEAKFLEIEPEEKIVFDHISPPCFEVTATFDAVDKNMTKITFTMRFETAELCNTLRGFVTPKNEENFDRLEALLSGSL